MVGYPFKIENMRKNIVWDLSMPFIDYLEDLRRIDICSPALKYYNNANKEQPNYTIGEMIKKYPPKQGWSRSMLIVYDGKLSKDFRKKYMDLVKDDVLNYRLWKELVHITLTELGQLKKKFLGKLPNIERNK